MKSNQLISVFKSFLEKNCIANNLEETTPLSPWRGAGGEVFLLAVSGGLDSVVMADLFFQSGYSFSISHCNFNLRGDESNGDEKFVRVLAEKFKVQFFVEHFDTEKIVDEESISIQMAARKLRYDFFERIRSEHQYNFIATAHHQQDSTETVLLNIIRGTGLEGLKGIAAKNNFVIRPLLFAAREQLLEYATANKLTWREDSSNPTIDYQRNFIRHKIIPLLKEINPSVNDSIANLSSITNESILLLNETIESYRNECLTQSGKDFILSTKKINHHPANKTLLYHLLKDFNFNSSQIESMLSDNDRSGIIFYSDSHRLIVNRQQFIISPLSNQNESSNFLITDFDLEINLAGEAICIGNIADKKHVDVKSNNPSSTFIDVSKIKFPLLLRRWQKGDYFYPLGMEHRKKLSDYFTDEKFSLIDKEKTWLLMNNDEVVWVVNHRLDNRYRVTDATKNVVQLKIVNSANQNG